MDAVTHALEALVAVTATEFTHGMVMEAVRFLSKYLRLPVPRALQMSRHVKKSIMPRPWREWRLRMHFWVCVTPHPMPLTRYARLADYRMLGGETKSDKVEHLIHAVIELRKTLTLPATIQEAGVSRAAYRASWMR